MTSTHAGVKIRCDCFMEASRDAHRYLRVHFELTSDSTRESVQRVFERFGRESGASEKAVTEAVEAFLGEKHEVAGFVLQAASWEVYQQHLTA